MVRIIQVSPKGVSAGELTQSIKAAGEKVSPAMEQVFGHVRATINRLFTRGEIDKPKFMKDFETEFGRLYQEGKFNGLTLDPDYKFHALGNEIREPQRGYGLPIRLVEPGAHYRDYPDYPHAYLHLSQNDGDGAEVARRLIESFNDAAQKLDAQEVLARSAERGGYPDIAAKARELASASGF